MLRVRFPFIPLLFFAAFSIPSQAQPFQARLFGEGGVNIGRACVALPDQGIAALGFTSGQGTGNDDFLLIRLDAQLRVAWAKTYGGGGTDKGAGIVRNGETGFLLMGQTKSYGAGGEDVLIVSVDFSGNPIWARVYGGSGDDLGYSLHPVRGGGFLICGTTQSFGSHGWAAFFLRIDEAGKVLWMRLYDNWSTDAAADFEQTSDDGFIATGWAYSVGAGMHDVFVFKTDVNGNLLWSRLFGGPRDDGGHTVHELASGNYIVNGNTHSFGHGGIDTYILHLARSGDLLWAKAIGMGNDDSFSKSFRDSDSSIVLAGWLTNQEANNKEIWLARISGSGNILYSGRIRSTSSAHASALVNRRKNNYVLAGESQLGTNSPPKFLVGTVGLPGHRENRSLRYEPQPFATLTQSAALSPPTRLINCSSTTVTVATTDISIAGIDANGRLESMTSGREGDLPHGTPQGRWEIAGGDSERFILSRITQIVDSKVNLQRQVPCDFSLVERELERTESILRIGDFERSLESLWKAESLLNAAPCGPVTIEELKALGSYYDRKTIELTASIMRREPSPSGDGYFVTFADKTGQIEGFYSGSLRDIMINDQVLIEGSYSYGEAMLMVRTMTKQDSPQATGLLAAGLAVFIAVTVLVYRLIKRRSSVR